MKERYALKSIIRYNRIKKVMFIFVVIALLIIVMILVMALIGNYFYNFAINSKTSKEAVFAGNAENKNLDDAEINEENMAETENEDSSDEDSNEEKTANLTEAEIAQNWLLENSTDVYIQSNDNLKLHAYSVEHPTDGNNWVIIVHGYGNKGNAMGDKARIFYEKGYNTLVIDLRGSGKSEGDYIGMGWPDRLDIVSWINYINEQKESCKIILYGQSMGAAAVMMATGEKLPSNVKVAIEDCGYTSVWDELEYQMKKLFGLNSFPFLNVANITTKIRAGYSFKKASSVEQLKKSVTPTLFIHGDSDEFVPSYMLDINYEAASCEKEKLLVEGAGHVSSSKIAPELYWETVDNFIAKYIDK